MAMMLDKFVSFREYQLNLPSKKGEHYNSKELIYYEIMELAL